MISILKRKKKCSICGKPGEGLIFRNMRLENLPPVFLCMQCLACVRAVAEGYEGKEEPKPAECGESVQKRKEAGSEGQADRKNDGKTPRAKKKKEEKE